MVRRAANRLTRRSALLRMVKFGTVGVSGTLLNLALFSILTLVLQLHYLVAALVAIEFALCSNYLLNNLWTFADRSAGRASWAGLAKYQAVATGGTLINLGLLHVFAGRMSLPPIAANAAGIAAATMWNFTLSMSWTWRRSAVAATQLASQSY
jgi:dolichol-phosphate mannosyltransferase